MVFTKIDRRGALLVSGPSADAARGRTQDALGAATQPLHEGVSRLKIEIHGI